MVAKNTRLKPKKKEEITGASRESNPGPPAPRAEIIPLDHVPLKFQILKFCWVIIYGS